MNPDGARRIIWQITSWNCSPVRRWEPSPGAAVLSCDFRTIQVYPKDLRALPGHPEPAVSWHSGFRGGAHARPKATRVPHAVRRRGGRLSARSACGWEAVTPRLARDHHVSLSEHGRFGGKLVRGHRG